jgi:ElaB/YqjD/DUF883 family membrane-anchored ribosome-binding protein
MAQTMDTPTVKETNGKPTSGIADTAGDATREAAGAVRRAVSDVRAGIPDAVATSRDAIDKASSTLETAPEPYLIAGAAFAVGLGSGLLLGGAPRLLIAAAVVPAVACGMALLGRSQDSAQRLGGSKPA